MYAFIILTFSISKTVMVCLFHLYAMVWSCYPSVTPRLENSLVKMIWNLCVEYASCLIPPSPPQKKVNLVSSGICWCLSKLQLWPAPSFILTVLSLALGPTTASSRSGIWRSGRTSPTSQGTLDRSRHWPSLKMVTTWRLQRMMRSSNCGISESWKTSKISLLMIDMRWDRTFLGGGILVFSGCLVQFKIGHCAVAVFHIASSLMTCFVNYFRRHFAIFLPLLSANRKDIVTLSCAHSCCSKFVICWRLKEKDQVSSQGMVHATHKNVSKTHTFWFRW